MSDCSPLVPILRGIRNISLFILSLLFQGGDDGLVKVWDTHNGYLIYTIRAHQEAVNDIAVNEENTLVATASSDGYVRVWKMGEFTPVVNLDAHTNSPSASISRCCLIEPFLILYVFISVRTRSLLSSSPHRLFLRLVICWRPMRMDFFAFGSGTMRL